MATPPADHTAAPPGAVGQAGRAAIFADRARLTDTVAVSRVAWGLMRLTDDREAGDPVKLAAKIARLADAGVTTMDHADIYQDGLSESLFGAALAAAPGLRDRLELVSKCGIVLPAEGDPARRVKHYNTTAAHIRRQCEASLRRLGVEALDLYLIHRPDPLMDPEAVAEAATRLLAEGKIKAFGVSNFPATTAALLERWLGRPLVTNQIELSLLNAGAFTDGTLDWCLEHKRPPMIWSPLGGARLFRGTDATAVRVRATLMPIAEKMGVPPEAVALAWVLQHPSRPVAIVGSNTPARLAAAVTALDLLPLDRQDWYALWEAARGVEIP